MKDNRIATLTTIKNICRFFLTLYHLLCRYCWQAMMMIIIMLSGLIFSPSVLAAGQVSLSCDDATMKYSDDTDFTISSNINVNDATHTSQQIPMEANIVAKTDWCDAGYDGNDCNLKRNGKSFGMSVMLPVSGNSINVGCQYAYHNPTRFPGADIGIPAVVSTTVTNVNNCQLNSQKIGENPIICRQPGKRQRCQIVCNVTAPTVELCEQQANEAPLCQTGTDQQWDWQGMADNKDYIKVSVHDPQTASFTIDGDNGSSFENNYGVTAYQTIGNDNQTMEVRFSGAVRLEQGDEQSVSIPYTVTDDLGNTVQSYFQVTLHGHLDHTRYGACARNNNSDNRMVAACVGGYSGFSSSNDAENMANALCSALSGSSCNASNISETASQYLTVVGCKDSQKTEYYTAIGSGSTANAAIAMAKNSLQGTIAKNGCATDDSGQPKFIVLAQPINTGFTYQDGAHVHTQGCQSDENNCHDNSDIHAGNQYAACSGTKVNSKGNVGGIACSLGYADSNSAMMEALSSCAESYGEAADTGCSNNTDGHHAIKFAGSDYGAGIICYKKGYYTETGAGDNYDAAQSQAENRVINDCGQDASQLEVVPPIMATPPVANSVTGIVDLDYSDDPNSVIPVLLSAGSWSNNAVKNP